MQSNQLFIYFIWVSMFISCALHEEKINKIPDSIVHLNLIPFHDFLTNIKDQNDLIALQTEYPEFSELYFQQLIQIHDSRKESQGVPLDSIFSFINDPYIQHLTDTCHLIFSDIDVEINKLSLALGYLKEAIDMDSTLNVYTFLSGFNYQQILFLDKGKEALGIGMDLFLGGDYPYHRISPENPIFSNYLSRTYNTSHIARKALDLIIEDRMPPPADGRFLDYIVRNGIKWYLMDEVLPETHDTIITEFSKSQLDWCLENEIGIWSFILDNELLYERELSKIVKYINPSPNAPGMPESAPGQVGNYLGWQIVKAYMRKNPDTNFLQLIQNNFEAQSFLEKSQYKPSRI